MSSNDVSVVLVHGAWADGSSWAKVIAPLAADGFKVVAAPLPLTSFRDDVAALDRTLERVTGPIVLVGHAYAGAVIAATRDEKVKGLVYVAALAPDEGETVADCLLPHRAAPAGAQAGSRQSRADLSPRVRLRRGLRAKRYRAGTGRVGGGSAADLAGMHHRCRRSTAVEGPSDLVPRGRAGPHDHPRESALHGRADEGSGARASRRSHADRDRALRRRGHHPRGDCRGLGLDVCRIA